MDKVKKMSANISSDGNTYIIVYKILFKINN